MPAGSARSPTIVVAPRGGATQAPAWAGVDRISLPRRPPRPTPGAPQRSVNDLIAVVGGLALYVLFMGGVHRWLVGVPAV